MLNILDFLSSLSVGIGLALVFVKTISFSRALYDRDELKIYETLEPIVIGLLLLVFGLVYIFILKR